MTRDRKRPGRLGGFDLLAKEAADEAYRNVMMLRDAPYGDSPIENLFFAALVTTANMGGRQITSVCRFVPGRTVEKSWEVATTIDNAMTVAMVQKQASVAGWRVDFVVYFLGWGENDRVLKRLIVECDGHDFHERTKAQAARDRARDRFAQHEGLPIFRFTGSELWNDPVGCAEEVLDFIERLPGPSD